MRRRAEQRGKGATCLRQGGLWALAPGGLPALELIPCAIAVQTGLLVVVLPAKRSLAGSKCVTVLGSWVQRSGKISLVRVPCRCRLGARATVCAGLREAGGLSPYVPSTSSSRVRRGGSGGRSRSSERSSRS